MADKVIKFEFGGEQRSLVLENLTGDVDSFYDFDEKAYSLNDHLYIVMGGYVDPYGYDNSYTASVSLRLKSDDSNLTRIYEMFAIHEDDDGEDGVVNQDDLFNFYDCAVKSIVRECSKILDDHIYNYVGKLNSLIEAKKKLT